MLTTIHYLNTENTQQQHKKRNVEKAFDLNLILKILNQENEAGSPSCASSSHFEERPLPSHQNGMVCS